MQPHDDTWLPANPDFSAIYQGCGGWNEFRALFPGTELESLPEPARVILAQAKCFNGKMSGRALWHDGLTYWDLDAYVGNPPCILGWSFLERMLLSKVADKAMLYRLIRECRKWAQNLADAEGPCGPDPYCPLPEWQEAHSLARRIGYHLMWDVQHWPDGECDGADFHHVATYGNVGTAVRHLRAERLQEQHTPKESENSYNESSQWYVLAELRRDALPPDLAEYDRDGTLSRLWRRPS